LPIKRHILRSDTDNDVIPHLIEEEIKKGKNLKDAVINALSRCQGSYGVVVCHAGTDYMVVARKESPLTIGVIPRESTYCASDIPAFLPLTRTAYVLEDEELAILKPGEVEVYDIKTNKKQERKPINIEWSVDAAEKVLDGKEYKWFMHKELHEIPQKIREQLRIQKRDR
jgi:glucosamine--fructose-6-phosphate aminotransferase (isomerizing)